MSDPQQLLDTRALEMAIEAHTLIKAHIESCDRKYSEFMEGQRILFQKLDNMAGRWLVIAGGAIVMLMGIIGFLLSEALF